MNNKKFEIDMSNGPLFGKILIFSIPLMLSGILQLLFSATNMIVAGRYIGENALAAIGSTSSLINLLINLFIGLSIGTSVNIAHYYGAKKYEDASQTVHTSILLSIIGSICLAIFSFIFARTFLQLMGTPAEFIDLATTYLRVYFLGIPAMLLYNFGSAILRAIGDTKRPLYFLIISGFINVVLNLLFVKFLHLGIIGTALGTILSECVSATLVLICLVRHDGCVHLDFTKLRIHKDKLFRILKIGLPAGLQGSIFAISNVLIQSSVNSFGHIAVAGNSATMNLEGFVYISMNAFSQAALSFSGQNMGAKKYKRILKVLLICLFCVFIVGNSMCLLGKHFGSSLLSLYTDDPDAIAYGLNRMSVIFLTYFLCGIMEVFVGCIRGLGASLTPMIVSLLGACGFRILWIFTIFQWNNNLQTLYISYPISWGLTAFVHLICFIIIYKKTIANNSLSPC